MLPRRLRAVLFAGAALVAAAAPWPVGAGAAAAPADCAQPAGPPVEALSTLPAPRVIGLSGSVPIVTMQPFAEFLIAMGYPEASLRDPRDGSLALSSYTDSAELAGAIAWYYERDGMRPMLVGHSQGGMLVVRTLHELSGAFRDAIPVFDPVEGRALSRTSIRDPYTQAERPVVGVRVSFAAALATGALPRLLLGQWTMLPRLRKIPDTALEFTGFTVPWDPIAGNLATAEPYVATGTATVRNVLLPATYTHIGLPATEHLAAQPAARAWIDAYVPGAAPPLPDAADADLRNLVHAADLWHSIRVHWCREGQRRAALRGPA